MHNKSPLFSVIIPAYNVSSYVRECVDSVINQTCGDFECVCIDDGSTDGTGPYLQKIASQDARFVYIRQANAGVSAARNEGLRIASGRWIIFLDADDMIDRYLFEDLKIQIEKHPNLQLIHFGYQEFKDGFEAPSARREFAWEVIDSSHRITPKTCNSHFASFAYEKSSLQGCFFAPYRRGEDHLFLVKLISLNVDEYLETDAGYYGYRVRPGSEMCSKPSFESLRDEFLHFIDIVGVINRSSKIITPAECGVEVNVLYSHPIRSKSCCSREETILMELFYNNLGILSRANGLSGLGRVVVFLNRMIRLPGFARCLARVGLCLCRLQAKARIMILRLFELNSLSTN